MTLKVLTVAESNISISPPATVAAKEITIKTLLYHKGYKAVWKRFELGKEARSHPVYKLLPTYSVPLGFGYGRTRLNSVSANSIWVELHECAQAREQPVVICGQHATVEPTISAQYNKTANGCPIQSAY